MTATKSPIGASVPRIEGPEKVTGRAVYAADVALPGTLVGRILRSPVPHARIKSIDTSAAWQVPGVRAIVTGQDIPGHYMGKVLRDLPVLCWDRVRYIGDRVAAVAAETIAAADEAIALIKIEYEELSAVFDPLEAMEPAAPLLHDDVAAYDGFPLERRADDLHNGQTRLKWTKGDIDAGLREADVVLEHTFRIPSRHQGYLEPHSSTVAIDPDGRVQVWTATKAPFRARIQLAKAAGIPEQSIKVNVVFVGGDFGGKGEAMDSPIAYFLAKQAGQPVRITMSGTEELTASNPSHPTVITIRSGVTRDGRITGRWVRCIHASGAYGGLKPNAALSTWHYVGGPYRVPHSSFEFLQIYTNTTPGGYFRAPGAHQYTFALEGHTDLLAQAIGMDPIEFRFKNIISEGEQDAVGTVVRGIKAKEVLQAAVDASTKQSPERKRGNNPQTTRQHSLAEATPLKGRGIALFGRQIGGGAGGAILTARADGGFTLLSPTFDMGAGTHTIEKQIVAAEMGVSLDMVQVEIGDTDTAPFDEGPRASRVTYTEGAAVMKACEEARTRLKHGERPPFTIRIEHDAPQPHDCMYFSAQVADVDLDPETGQVEVTRLVTVHDVGTIINPITHQGQIDGGVITGYGLALTEELISEDGRITNPNLGEYKMPTIADIPTLETVLLASPGGTGPYEAKAIGELSNNAPPAAIANAVANAGARLFELPITAERVYRALSPRHSEGAGAPG